MTEQVNDEVCPGCGSVLLGTYIRLGSREGYPGVTVYVGECSECQRYFFEGRSVARPYVSDRRTDNQLATERYAILKTASVCVEHAERALKLAREEMKTARRIAALVGTQNHIESTYERDLLWQQEIRQAGTTDDRQWVAGYEQGKRMARNRILPEAQGLSSKKVYDRGLVAGWRLHSFVESKDKETAFVDPFDEKMWGRFPGVADR